MIDPPVPYRPVYLSDGRTLPSSHKIVNDQLPAGIRDKIYVDIKRDPHGLKTKARFYRRDDPPNVMPGNRLITECELESMDFDGYSRMLKIPEEIISHLCVVA